MDPARISELRAWLIEAGLAGESETALLDGVCRRLPEAGLPIARAVMLIDTLHPVYEGRAFFWRRQGGEQQTELVEYGPSNEGEMAETWRRSVFFHLLQTEGSLVRVRFHAGETTDFPTIAQMRDEGMSDVVAMITRFAGARRDRRDGLLYSYWATDHPQGFDDGARRGFAALDADAGAGGQMRVAGPYRGHAGGDLSRPRRRPARAQRADPARRRRQISAVLWYSDLRGFTRITDRAEPEQIIPLLNDYAEAVISAVYDNGGDVLKLIGDGTLAIFTADDPEEACRAALAAQGRCGSGSARSTRRARRRPAGHRGLSRPAYRRRVLRQYRQRRTARLHGRRPGGQRGRAASPRCAARWNGRPVLAGLRRRHGEAGAGRLVSVGRYALRGVARPQELFTLDPFWTA